MSPRWLLQHTTPTGTTQSAINLPFPSRGPTRIPLQAGGEYSVIDASTGKLVKAQLRRTPEGGLAFDADPGSGPTVGP